MTHGRIPGARIPNYQMFAYCGITFPIVAVGMPVSTFLPPLYAGHGGLGLATVGLIFMIARIWDVISDPIVGILVDRFQWRRGRRKTWIVVSIPLLCLTALFLFMPDRGSPASGPVLLFQLLLLYTGWTFLQTAHQAWGADLAQGYDERSRLFGTREIVNAAGTIFVLTLPALAGFWIDVDEYTEVAIMGWFLILALPISIVIAFSLVSDKSPPHVKDVRPKSLKDVFDSLNNRTLWRILFIEITTGIGVGVTSATFLFVARGVAGFESGASTVLLVFFIASIVGIPIWLWFSKRLEKATSLQIACVYSLICNLILIPVLMYGNTMMFVAMVALLGISFGAPQALLRSMMADQVDREEVRSGKNNAGFYFAFMNTSYKIGQATAVGISFALLALIGFDPEAPGNPDHVTGLVMVFTLVPVLIFTICILLCRHYPLTREAHEKDREILEGRNTQ
ncbi:MAG: MFS transporter [Alphaproteobacteria bacterium]|nr:MAG: MFS transporter [Alphaproteobacteria bacterium]